MHVKKLSTAAVVAALATVPFAASPAAAHPPQCPGSNAASSVVYEANHGVAHVTEEAGGPVHGTYDGTVSPQLTAVECAIADAD